MSAALIGLRVAEALAVARAQGASDVHFSAGEPPVLRLDGRLTRSAGEPFTATDAETIARTLLADSNAKVFEATGFADGAMHSGPHAPCRFHVYRCGGSVHVAVRLLASRAPDLETLALPTVVASFVRRSTGLVLIAGPTGSGKTTTLAALVGQLNAEREIHVLTVEDPLEYVHQPLRATFSQQEVGPDVSTFAEAVRQGLRADPDVVVVGELRDAATMSAALAAAETGHLVLSTLHTGDAPHTVDRIVDAFPGDEKALIRAQLAATVAAVACLRLVPRAEARGRIAAVEIMVATDAVRGLIRDGKTHQLRNVIATSRASGMQTLEAHLSELVLRGEVLADDARSATDRPEEIRLVNCGSTS